jgi:hypothetical protein
MADRLADFQVQGDDDFVGTVAADLSARGLTHCVQQVREKLYAFHQEAVFQAAITN